VVFYSASLGWRYLPRSHVQAAINLSGIGRNDFAAQVIRQANA